MTEKISHVQPDKFVLIYEVNDDSPLFSYAADKKINEGKIDDAIKILEKGLTKFPAYITPLFLYAKALAFQGKREEAFGMISKASELFDCSESLNYYEKLIVDILSGETEMPEIAGQNPEENRMDRKEETVPAAGTQSEFEDNLEILAKELEVAKITAKEVPQEIIEKHKKLNEANNKIVTETLAGIYLDQNVWDKALEIYRELIVIRPEKADFYRQKIERIEEILNKKKKD